MTESESTPVRCACCGEPLDSPADDSAAPSGYCSSGCRDVATALGDAPDRRADATVLQSEPGDETVGPAHEGLVRTYLRVDGTYAATCEAYLESAAESLEGVVDASASYVTETVRVDHDPDLVSPADLEVALTRLGYTAYIRDEATGGPTEGDSSRDGDASSPTTGACVDSQAGAETRAVNEPDSETGAETGADTRTVPDSATPPREQVSRDLRERRSADVLELRYVLGVVFGGFLLVPYAAVFYPVYLASFSDWGVLAHYSTFEDFGGVAVVPVLLVVTGAVLYLAGMPLLRGAYVSLRLRRPNAHLLAALTIVAAFAYGTLAFAAGRLDVYYDVTIVVAAVVVAAIYYESAVKRHASDRLTDLTSSRVAHARRYADDGTTETVPVDDVAPGDHLLVRAGERIPVDGWLLEGSCTVAETVVTGESLPVPKEPGDDLVGGSVVRSDAAIIAVGDAPSSRIDRLTESVWDVQSATHGVGRQVDAVAAILAPIVLAAGALVAAGSYALGADVTNAALAGLLAIVVVSPWALAFAPPITVAQHVREALESGIVVFDESIFERLREVDVVVFDKTGTLTTGEMVVHETDAPDDLFAAAAALEDRAAHPAARAVAAAVDDETRATVTVEDFESNARGVAGVVDGQQVLVGHPDEFRDRGWELSSTLAERLERVRESGRLPVVVGRDGTAEGLVVVGDEPRAAWDDALEGLAETGVDVVVLTGDDATAAATFEAHPAVTYVFAGVSPAGKTAAVRRLQEPGVGGKQNPEQAPEPATVAMVGDGTNDGPALAAADLGIALGSGTALASEAADLAILEDDLAGVSRAFRLASAARSRLRRTAALAFTYNVVVIPIALAGVMTPLFATGAAALTAGLVAASASRPLLE
ncbi:heavy metal translocating P-type ATPase [Natrarchaeobaculum aegyptiacum]|uniref:ATPase P n=1 Tax=Natrarchaeobaculum aegyptiacum TaxID=745377 RepID=A0A2Z2HTI9_9EURY|nr:heavy metal translocating P-type ATPase [Natrarchaeobaculum aegyptiacum]ARS89445.1 ATPase P [Natrarchaeobaculum aegyptiacum]